MARILVRVRETVNSTQYSGQSHPWYTLPPEAHEDTRRQSPYSGPPASLSIQLRGLGGFQVHDVATAPTSVVLGLDFAPGGFADWSDEAWVVPTRTSYPDGPHEQGKNIWRPDFGQIGVPTSAIVNGEFRNAAYEIVVGGNLQLIRPSGIDIERADDRMHAGRIDHLLCARGRGVPGDLDPTFGLGKSPFPPSLGKDNPSAHEVQFTKAGMIPPV